MCEYEPVTARNIRDYIKGLLRKLGGKETTLERALTLYNKALKDVAAKAQADTEGRMRLKAAPETQKQESGLRLPGAVQYSTADEVLARTDIDWMDDDSSIKEQLEKHADDLKQMEPVAAVEYNPASANKLVKLMLDEVSRIGGKRMSRNGISFDFDQKGAENIDRHAETDEKRAAALAAPYVAKYGKIIAGQKNHEGTGLTTITIGAPVVINGTTVNEGVVVQFDKNGRPRAINVGLQGGGVFSIKKLETLKGPGSRVYRIGKGTALPTMSASEEKVTQNNEKSKRQFSVDDADTYNRTALVTEDTVDKWLKDYAAKSSPKYAQAYITRMTPKQFVDLTTSTTGRLLIGNQTGAMDAEKLIEATRDQPLQIQISDGEVVGHEGRHRATALSRAGVNSIPVLVFDYSNKYSKTDVPEMTLQGQDFGHSRSYAIETLRDLIPLSYENRDRIVQEYGTQPATEQLQEKYNGRKTMQFSAEDSDAEYRQAPGTEALEKLGVKLAGSKGRYELDRFLPVEYNAAVSKQGSRASAAKARM